MTNSPSDQIEPKVTQEELREIFGATMPWEALEAIQSATSANALRAKLREIAANAKSSTSSDQIVEVMANAFRKMTMAEVLQSELSARAALSALKQAGFAIVPVEPTEAMLEAAHKDSEGEVFIGPPSLDGIPAGFYRAMLQAHDPEPSNER